MGAVDEREVGQCYKQQGTFLSSQWQGTEHVGNGQVES